jgi:hypothetical protein
VLPAAELVWIGKTYLLNSAIAVVGVAVIVGMGRELT